MVLAGAVELVSIDTARTMRRAVPDGSLVIGRSPDSDLFLDTPEVSRAHARIVRRGTTITVEDLDSVNGTLLNGANVHEPVPLHAGDRLQIGPVTLELHGNVPGDDRTRPRRFDIGQQAGGQIWNVGGDVHSTTVTGEDDPWDELFQGTGLGRLLMAVGLLAVIVGFGMWMAFIFSGFSPPAGVDPFTWDPLRDGPQILGLPQPVVGFALFAGGGLLAGIGSGLSRAARRRRGETVRPIRKDPRRSR